MSSQSGYVKLTRRSAALASYQSLWKGADHLLLVTSNGYTERYQRFQYADIKTFVVLPSERRAYWTWVWLVSALLFGIFAWIALYKGDTPFFSGPAAVLCAIGLLWNFVLGPSCETFIVTRVQTLRLSLNRLRRAEKFINRVLPEIAAAQSELLVPSESAPVEPPPIS